MSGTGTPMIHDLVSEVRATPEQGALLIEFRRELAESRERKLRSRSPITNMLIAMGAFVLVLLGVRKQS
jgi:hypothetical protein